MSTSEDTEAAAKPAAKADAPAARLPQPTGPAQSSAKPAKPAKPGKGPRPQGKGPAAGRPAAQRPPAPRRPGRATPRRVRLTMSRVDPWSVMKIAFLLSVAAAIAGVVMVAVLWTVLSGMGVFSDVQDMLRTLSSDSGGSSFNLMDYIGFGRMVSLAVVIGVIDIVLLTAIATLSAFLYNICASLVGGVQLTLSDE
ncbi:DUF3566 domain-containing protein [Luteipulveratus halotolerans]|uniref:DUF3566 domain-containing protein n=1 Tax=Luteipulveratus halotolerans TaxID=1631356 RepID=UPI0008FC0C1B|nr:DUF3566 domain-containing protein [Luteipulveratus halotolerans]